MMYRANITQPILPFFILYTICGPRIYVFKALKDVDVQTHLLSSFVCPCIYVFNFWCKNERCWQWFWSCWFFDHSPLTTLWNDFELVYPSALYIETPVGWCGTLACFYLSYSMEFKPEFSLFLIFPSTISANIRIFCFIAPGFLL